MVFSDLPELSLEQAALYSCYYEQSATELADAAPNSRFAWNPGYSYRYLILEDCFCLVSDGGLFYKPHFCLPLGLLDQGKLERICAYMGQLFQAMDWELRCMFIDEQYCPLFESLSSYERQWRQEDALSDYLYDAEALRTLVGRDYRSKRNHVNRFRRSYPNFEYRQLSYNDKEAALELILQWCQDRGVNCSDPNESDFLPIRTVFEAMPALAIRGGSIYVAGELCGFTIGSLVHKDRAIIHFEKGHPDFEGVYPALNQLALQHSFPEAVLVNREEDMGIEGMRISKQSYLPCRLIKKFEVVLRAPS